MKNSMRRGKYFEGLRRSVVPYLTGLGGEDPRLVAKRIQKRLSLPITQAFVSQEQWRRW